MPPTRYNLKTPWRRGKENVGLAETQKWNRAKWKKKTNALEKKADELRKMFWVLEKKP